MGASDALVNQQVLNGQKMREATYKDGKEVSKTEWDEEGNEIKE